MFLDFVVLVLCVVAAVLVIKVVQRILKGKPPMSPPKPELPPGYLSPDDFERLERHPSWKDLVQEDAEGKKYMAPEDLWKLRALP